MALCRDESLTYLARLGYNIVRLPRTGIEPLDVLGKDGRSLERLGKIDQLWTSAKPLPAIGAPQPAVPVEGQRTSNLNLSIGLKLLTGVLNSIGAASPELAFAYKGAATLQFAFANVTSVSINAIDLGDFLAAGDLKAGNPFVDRYFLEEDTDAYVLTEVLKSDQITVSAKTDKGGSLKVDVPAIEEVVGANVEVSRDTSDTSRIIYKGTVPVTFGFRAFAIAFASGKWLIEAAEPSDAVAFGTSEGVILGRGLLSLKSA